MNIFHCFVYEQEVTPQVDVWNSDVRFFRILDSDGEAKRDVHNSHILDNV